MHMNEEMREAIENYTEDVRKAYEIGIPYI